MNKFDNIHKDHRGFVFGGGPSIKVLIDCGFDFRTLVDEVTVGTNRAYELLDLDYLVWMDTYFWVHYRDFIKKLKCVKFCPKNVYVNAKIDQFDNTVIPLTKDVGPEYQKRVLPVSFSNPFSFWNNSGVTGIRVAYMLGCNPIYLLGMDLTHTGDQTHFHSGYDDKRRISTDKTYTRFRDPFEVTIKAIQDKGIKVYSCSKTSTLNSTLIPFVDITTLF